jgi:uncharacterized membrane protein
VYSKAKIGGHPIHPMLIAFPVAFYTATFVAFIVYAADRGMFAFHFAVTSNIIGVVMAAVAAIPGTIDLFFGIPERARAKRDGLLHAGFNVFALLLFLINAIVMGRQWNWVRPYAALPVVLSLFGLLCTLVAGTLGWTLVQSHHVGVVLTPEQERLERLGEVRGPTEVPVT